MKTEELEASKEKFECSVRPYLPHSRLTKSSYGDSYVLEDDNRLWRAYQSGYAELAAEVIKLREQQRWIPVSKRLPKPYESVLAWVGGGLEILFIETRLDGSDPRWNKTFSSDPTHWMPLLAAPAGEQA